MSTGDVVAARPLMDGQRVRWTLEQQAQSSQGGVRVDWCRFTLPLDAIVRFDRQLDPDLSALAILDRRERETVIACRTADADLDYSGAMAVARSGAQQFVNRLGLFEVGQVEDRQMDYYAARCPIVFEGATVGFVLAGGKSINQAGTVHFNIFGEACLMVSPAKWQVIRAWLSETFGRVTRIDLAVDVWEGDEIAALPSAYRAGAFDVRGQRPSQTENGSWSSGHSRTFNVGKRETGKMLRAYEKGDQLFGADADDQWIRYEVEFRNNARVIDLDVFTRPADFFAGAYPFCSDLLERLQLAAEPERIPAGQKLIDATAEAALHRGVKWFARVCAPTACWLLAHGGHLLDLIVENEEHRLPARFRGRTNVSLREAVEKVASRYAPLGTPSLNGA